VRLQLFITTWTILPESTRAQRRKRPDYRVRRPEFTALKPGDPYSGWRSVVAEEGADRIIGRGERRAQGQAASTPKRRGGRNRAVFIPETAMYCAQRGVELPVGVANTGPTVEPKADDAPDLKV